LRLQQLNERILVIEDEPDIREVISYNLSKEGYRVITASTGEEGLRSAFSQLPDLVVLDLMLPGVYGLDVCRQIRSDSRTAAVPIIMLTARSEESDIITGLEVGANDYITKPFSPRVLVAKVRARLREKTDEPDKAQKKISLKRISIDKGRHSVEVDGKPVELTPTEFKLLWLLAKNPGMVFSRYEIVNSVRGEDAVVTDRSVDVQVVGLRKKLGTCANSIETVRGVGYRLRS
jgi:two-component system phosphate regulon response regulator PhoB